MTETTNETTAPALDWSVLDDETVVDVLDLVSRKVAGLIRNAMTSDDLRQEGSIVLAQHAATVRGYLLDEQVGGWQLRTWLENQLRNIARKAERVAARETPLSNVIDAVRASEEG